MKKLNKTQIAKFSPQQTRLYNALRLGNRVDSLTCGVELGISGSGLHHVLFSLKEKGLEIENRPQKTSYGTRYLSYYL